jgi:hypothetical protein
MNIFNLLFGFCCFRTYKKANLNNDYYILVRKSRFMNIYANDTSKLTKNFRSIFAHHIFGVRFRIYAAEHIADEGLLFFDEIITQMEAEKTVGIDLKAVSTCLVDKYFTDESALNINLSYTSKMKLIKDLDSNNFKNLYELFDTVMSEIFNDLKLSTIFCNYINFDCEANIFLETT